MNLYEIYRKRRWGKPLSFFGVNFLSLDTNRGQLSTVLDLTIPKIIILGSVVKQTVDKL